MCDRFGNVISKTKLTDVAMIQSGYNLFSCTKMQMKGWTLGGNTEAIWLKKGKEIIKFDIKISTPKNDLCYVHAKKIKSVRGRKHRQ